MTATVDSPATQLPPEDLPPSAGVDSVERDEPRRIGGLGVDEVASALGCLVGSLGLTWVLFENLISLWSGTVGFFLTWWIAFLVLYAGVSAIGGSRPVVIDRLMKAVVVSGALLVLFALATVIGFTVWNGRHAVAHLNFYSRDMSGVLPSAGLEHGGISHALVGTALQVGIATGISMPLGLITAVYLAEVGGPLRPVVRTVIEAMTALPDILAGLFIYIVLILYAGWDKTGFAVSLALSVTMIPVVARSAEVVLRVVPSGLRESSLALGASRWRTVWNVVLPTARAGLATSLILGVARIAGETAPLLIVSGASTFLNLNPFKNPMNSLPLFIFAAVKAGQGGPSLERAYGAALVLLVFVLVLFIIARLVARDKVGKR